MLITEIGSGLLIANDLIGRLHPYAAMIGGQDEIDLFVSYLFQRLVQG